MDIDKLNEQFLSYQLLEESSIPMEIKDSIGLSSEDPFQIDILWAYLRGLKQPGTNILEFDLLFKVAEAVMTIPHSNAGEERMFSLISKNKTPSRSSLNLDGTLSSLLIVKTHIDDPIAWKPSETLITKAKKATKCYNDHHKK